MLGLATGSTPVRVYRELVRQHKAGALPFANVTSFNLDEYCGLAHGDLQSYHAFMAAHLFDHLTDMDAANIHIPDGALPAADMARYLLPRLMTWLLCTCVNAVTGLLAWKDSMCDQNHGAWKEGCVQIGWCAGTGVTK